MRAKEKKENIRSFRYSNKVAELLEAAPGNNMSDKFENLVLMQSVTLPELEERAKLCERRIAENQKILMEIERRITFLNHIIKKLNTIETQVTVMAHSFEEYIENY